MDFKIEFDEKYLVDCERYGEIGKYRNTISIMDISEPGHAIELMKFNTKENVSFVYTCQIIEEAISFVKKWAE